MPTESSPPLRPEISQENRGIDIDHDNEQRNEEGDTSASSALLQQQQHRRARLGKIFFDKTYESTVYSKNAVLRWLERVVPIQCKLMFLVTLPLLCTLVLSAMVLHLTTFAFYAQNNNVREFLDVERAIGNTSMLLSIERRASMLYYTSAIGSIVIPQSTAELLQFMEQQRKLTDESFLAAEQQIKEVRRSDVPDFRQFHTMMTTVLPELRRNVSHLLAHLPSTIVSGYEDIIESAFLARASTNDVALADPAMSARIISIQLLSRVRQQLDLSVDLGIIALSRGHFYSDGLRQYLENQGRLHETLLDFHANALDADVDQYLKMVPTGFVVPEQMIFLGDAIHRPNFSVAEGRTFTPVEFIQSSDAISAQIQSVSDVLIRQLLSYIPSLVQNGNNILIVVLIGVVLSFVSSIVLAFVLSPLITRPWARLNKLQVDIMNRFVPAEFLELLGLQSVTELSLNVAVRRKMAIMFVDIRNFTTRSENTVPEDIYKYLNEYLAVVCPVIRQFNGIVDKFLGDGILAIFEHPEQAVFAAVEMQRAVEVFNIMNRDKYEPTHIGIGINCGECVLGTLGDVARTEGTVIGDAVNAGSRIEGLTKSFHSRILIAESVRERLMQSPFIAFGIHTRRVGFLLVKGKARRITVYEVLDRKFDQIKIDTIPEFHEAMSLLRSGVYGRIPTSVQTPDEGSAGTRVKLHSVGSQKPLMSPRTFQGSVDIEMLIRAKKAFEKLHRMNPDDVLVACRLAAVDDVLQKGESSTALDDLCDEIYHFLKEHNLLDEASEGAQCAVQGISAGADAASAQESRHSTSEPLDGNAPNTSNA